MARELSGSLGHPRCWVGRVFFATLHGMYDIVKFHTLLRDAFDVHQMLR